MDFTLSDPWRDLVVLLTLATLFVSGFCSRECYHSRAMVRHLPVTRAELGGTEERLRGQRLRLVETAFALLFALNRIWKHRNMTTTDLTFGPVVLLITLNSLLTLRGALAWQHYFEQYPAQDERVEPEG